jgi:hypothetical protein
VWDLSQDQSTARVGWPADVHGHLWHVPGPLTVELTVPDRPPISYAAHHAQVRRKAGRVASVALMFPNESLDATYRRAKELAAEWDITDHRRLDAWYAARQRDGGRGIDPVNPNLSHVGGARAGIDVGPTFDATGRGPWHAALVVGFPENRPSPTSAPDSDAR